MLDNLEEYLDQECHTLEGTQGLCNMEKLVDVLGYKDMDDFLMDNSGAIEAMVNWIGSRRDSDWSSKLQEQLNID